MLTKHASLGLALCLSSSLFQVACSSDSGSPGTTSDGGGTDTATSGDSTPAEDAGADTAVADSGTATDTAVAADTAPASETLVIESATFKSSTAAGGGFVHAVVFSLSNTSSSAVTSLDTMVFDFGGGNTVQLTASACSGSFPIAAGAKRTIDTQVVVSTSGSLSNFSFICGATQRFGGASGKAPPDAAFAGPVAITVGGKTASGTFTATGSATPK